MGAKPVATAVSKSPASLKRQREDGVITGRVVKRWIPVPALAAPHTVKSWIPVPELALPSTPKPRKIRGKDEIKEGDTATEKRLRKYRPTVPVNFKDVLERATTQRFYVLSRTHRETSHCPEEIIELTGTTGNIYTVTIKEQPICNCPQGLEKKQCKHQIFVLICVLGATKHMACQLALLPSEVRSILAAAPPIVDANPLDAESHDPRRKPIDGDCPICFNELSPEGAEAETIVYCRAACGQNIHKECFEMWAATKRQQAHVPEAAKITCPYCRTEWQGDENMVKRIKNTGIVGSEGYFTVAEQLGISTERDHNNYSRWWSGHENSWRKPRWQRAENQR